MDPDDITATATETAVVEVITEEETDDRDA